MDTSIVDQKIATALSVPSQRHKILYEHSFSELEVEGKIKPSLFHALRMYGYHKPSKVQAHILFELNNDANFVLVRACGSGKSTGVLLRCLNEVESSEKKCQYLIFCPTYDTAYQMYSLGDKLNTGMGCDGVSIGLISKDMSMTENMVSQIIIGTNTDLIEYHSKAANGFALREVFFDDGDIIVNKKDVIDFSTAIARTARIRVLSSWTVDRANFQKYVPYTILRQNNTDFSAVNHIIIVDRDRMTKVAYMQGATESIGNYGQCIIFCQSKGVAKNIGTILQAPVHDGDLTYQQRRVVTDRWSAGDIPLLIASNVLSRGVRGKNVVAVINETLPFGPTGHIDYNTFLHRMGRCTQLGSVGVVLTFANTENAYRLQEYLYRLNMCCDLI